jgi:ABC-type multidrug transport system ATPase subunit
MIRIDRLTKSYGRLRVLPEVSLDMARGEGLGLAGPNGSGRTTLLRILATLVPPTSGTVEIDGLDVVKRLHQVRRLVGYAGDESLPGDGLSVGESLRFIARARLNPADAARAATDAVVRAGLDPRADVATLSAGFRQRLALAWALLPLPDVILLDDPLRALDGTARGRFIDWIREARDAGAALVVAANSDDDLRALCHRTVRLTEGLVAPSHRLAAAATGAAGISRGVLET